MTWWLTWLCIALFDRDAHPSVCLSTCAFFVTWTFSNIHFWPLRGSSPDKMPNYRFQTGCSCVLATWRYLCSHRLTYNTLPRRPESSSEIIDVWLVWAGVLLIPSDCKWSRLSTCSGVRAAVFGTFACVSERIHMCVLLCMSLKSSQVLWQSCGAIVKWPSAISMLPC